MEMNSFFTWHFFLEVGKTQDLLSKIWQTFGDALSYDLKNKLKTSTKYILTVNYYVELLSWIIFYRVTYFNGQLRPLASQ
jgi:hypothetical protein